MHDEVVKKIEMLNEELNKRRNEEEKQINDGAALKKKEALSAQVKRDLLSKFIQLY